METYYYTFQLGQLITNRCHISRIHAPGFVTFHDCDPGVFHGY
ncbi:MAG: hypothetical protein WHX93_10990 [bacterium]